MNKFIAAVLQLDSQDDVQANLDTVVSFVEEAAARGAKLITMPESMNYVGLDNAGHAEEVPGGPTFRLMSELAQKHQVWLHCGSIYEKNPSDPRPFNSTMVINPKGELAAKYHKIHPFDVVIPNGPVNKESERICPGSAIVTVDTQEVGCLGLSICYDLRFPEQFRRMVDNGATLFAVTAAWPRQRLEDWRLFCRARALENQSFLLACNHTGDCGGVAGAGHSMAVTPDGTVLAEAGTEEQVLTVELDLNEAQRFRRQFPALHDRVPLG